VQRRFCIPQDGGADKWPESFLDWQGECRQSPARFVVTPAGVVAIADGASDETIQRML